MNDCPPWRAPALLAALLMTLSAMLPLPVPGHQGEDHGAPEPVVTSPAAGESLLAVSGSGALFDAILKYRPFAQGETAAVTLYLVSGETNRPVAEATVSASLSEGLRSLTVAFTPRSGGPVGAYSASITPTTDAPMSWLFEVTAEDGFDLIGVTGFQARLLQADPAGGAASPQADWMGPSRRAGLAAAGVLLLAAAFAAGRMGARKRNS